MRLLAPSGRDMRCASSAIRNSTRLKIRVTLASGIAVGDPQPAESPETDGDRFTLGDLEVDVYGDFWADHDEDCHGEIDTEEMRKDYPTASYGKAVASRGARPKVARSASTSPPPSPQRSAAAEVKFDFFSYDARTWFDEKSCRARRPDNKRDKCTKRTRLCNTLIRLRNSHPFLLLTLTIQHV